MLLPAASTRAASLVLSAVLVMVGITKIMQAFETKEWPGFIWHLRGGDVEVVGAVIGAVGKAAAVKTTGS